MSQWFFIFDSQGYSKPKYVYKTADEVKVQFSGYIKFWMLFNDSNSL